MAIANTASPRIRPPLPLEREGREQRVEELGPRDDRQGDPAESAEQDRAVREGVAAPDREGDQEHGEDEPRDPQGGELFREDGGDRRSRSRRRPE